MAEGLVTFFKYERLGFFKRGSEEGESLDMTEMLDNLHAWHGTRTSLADTLPWDDETPGYQNRKKVYLKSVQHNPETGDYMIILWRAVGNGNGVYGIRSDSDLSDTRLYDANDAVEDGAQVIWGEPAYYWFIPRLNIFASIKFKSSVTDTDLMNKYLKDYINLHSDIRQKTIEERENTAGHTYTTVFFAPAAGGNEHLWFRIESKQFTKLTDQADLESIASEITQFVHRDVISAEEVQERALWQRLCQNLPFISNQVTRDTRRIELVIDAHPTADELQEMLDTYHERYGDGAHGWANIGFRKESAGGTYWLNEFVVKSVLPVPDLRQGIDDTGHYTTQRLFNALHLTRDRLLAPFSGGAVRQRNEAANESEVNEHNREEMVAEI
ncbi:hypothetical protein [Endozoicomonas sp. ALB115]|uniref:hypothetical protein n=1 Tax=Endozoicomonas sp. ALB115 TaxID=3403074 RepID=UPI003BB56230